MQGYGSSSTTPHTHTLSHTPTKPSSRLTTIIVSYATLRRLWNGEKGLWLADRHLLSQRTSTRAWSPNCASSGSGSSASDEAGAPCGFHAATAESSKPPPLGYGCPSSPFLPRSPCPHIYASSTFPTPFLHRLYPLPTSQKASSACLYKPFGLKSTSHGWDFIEEEVTLRTPFSHYFNPRASVHCIYKWKTSLTLFGSQIYEIVKGFYPEGEFILEGFLPCCNCGKLSGLPPSPLSCGCHRLLPFLTHSASHLHSVYNFHSLFSVKSAQ